MAHTFEDLVNLEQQAEREHQAMAGAGLVGEEYDAQRDRWREAAGKFQTAVTEYVAQDDVDATRYEIEQAVKKTVRHPEADG